MGEFAGKDLRARLRGHVEYLAGTLGERNPLHYASLEEARSYIERSLADSGYEILGQIGAGGITKDVFGSKVVRKGRNYPFGATGAASREKCIERLDRGANREPKWKSLIGSREAKTEIPEEAFSLRRGER